MARMVFAPGAGQPSSSPWMTAWAERLGTLGPVTRFDYPYVLAGRKRPDRLPVLLEAHRDALRALPGDGPVFLVGKSMGSRVGCHLALEEDVAGVICFGYPLAGAGDRTKLRDAVLRESTRPILFVQGTRDPLCPLDLLEAVRADMTCRTHLHRVQTGDHSLQVTKTHSRQTGRTQQDEDAAILDAVRAFTASCASP